MSNMNAPHCSNEGNNETVGLMDIEEENKLSNEKERYIEQVEHSETRGVFYSSLQYGVAASRTSFFSEFMPPDLNAFLTSKCKPTKAQPFYMTSAWRVASFFLVVFVLPTVMISVPLYARYHMYHAREMAFADGDMADLHGTASTFWCKGQKLSTNGTFKSYLMGKEPHRARNRRVSRTVSNVLLASDDIEQWGFYLIRGSRVSFSACSRWPGGSLLVVQGESNLRRCFYAEDRAKDEIDEGDAKIKQMMRGYLQRDQNTHRGLPQQDRNNQQDFLHQEGEAQNNVPQKVEKQDLPNQEKLKFQKSFNTDNKLQKLPQEKEKIRLEFPQREEVDIYQQSHPREQKHGQGVSQVEKSNYTDLPQQKENRNTQLHQYKENSHEQFPQREENIQNAYTKYENNNQHFLQKRENSYQQLPIQKKKENIQQEFPQRDENIHQGFTHKEKNKQNKYKNVIQNKENKNQQFRHPEVVTYKEPEGGEDVTEDDDSAIDQDIDEKLYALKQNENRNIENVSTEPTYPKSPLTLNTTSHKILKNKSKQTYKVKIEKSTDLRNGAKERDKTVKRKHVKGRFRKRAINDENTYEQNILKLLLENDSLFFRSNDTLGNAKDNSSYSSSEEFFEYCSNTIFSIDLTPTPNCRKSVKKSDKNITWTFQANESDYYYFIFTSDNSLEANIISLNLLLNRNLYDVSKNMAECSNSTECTFPFSFFKSEGVVVDFSESLNFSSLDEMHQYELKVICQPRSAVYTIFILLVPFIIIMFAFR